MTFTQSGCVHPSQDTDYSFINRLCIEEEIGIADTELIQFLEETEYEVETLVDSLNQIGMVGLDGEKMVMLTRECASVILPDGRFAAGENIAGQLTDWVINNSGNP